MSDDPARADFEATLDDFVDVYMRQIRRMPAVRRQFMWAAVFGGAIGAMLAMMGLDFLLRHPIGVETPIAFVVGGVAGRMFAPLYEHHVAHRARQAIARQYAGRLPMRCEIELRPTCLMVRQDQVDLSLDWSTAKSVEDTPDGIELWFRWGLVVARNRAFPTPAARDRFLTDARAKMPSTPSGGEGPSSS